MYGFWTLQYPHFTEDSDFHVNPDIIRPTLCTFQISRGIIIYLCFLKGTTLDLVPKVGKFELDVPEMTVFDSVNPPTLIFLHLSVGLN